MSDLLKTLKDQINPKDTDPHLGPKVYAVNGTTIPEIDPEALLAFDDLSIIGDSTIKRGAIVRRQSTIRNSTLEEFSVIMDYVTTDSAIVGARAVIAHGSHLQKGVKVEKDGFVNINATLDAGAVVQEDGYVGANAHIRQGEIVRNGLFVFGDPTAGRIAFPRARLRENLEPEDITQARMKYFRADDISRQTPSIMTMDRNDFLPFVRLIETDFTRLLSMGSIPWITRIREMTKRGDDQKLTFANWLLTYGVQQIVKQLGHLREDAVNHGPIVWHSSRLQADIFVLIRIRDILTAISCRELAQEVASVSEAFGFLVSAFVPQSSVLPELSRAFRNARTILLEASDRLRKCGETPTIQCGTEESVFDVFDGRALKPLRPFGINHAHLVTLAERAQRVGDFAHSLLARFDDHSGRLTSARTTERARTREIVSAEKLKQALNRKGLNLVTAPDATRVRQYHGHVPVIDSRAILLGCDISGIVHVRRCHCVATSIRSEQNSVPVAIDNGVVLSHAVLHTAVREQIPLVVYEGSVVAGKKDAMAWIHGATIGSKENRHPVFIGEGSVISDGEIILGFVAPNTLAPGSKRQDTDRWLYFIGNDFAEPLPPDKVSSNDRFMRYWNSSVFSGLDPKNVISVQQRIQEQGDAIRKNAVRVMEERVTEFGPAFRYSPHLQAAIHTLRYAATVLDTIDRVKLADNLMIAADGLEYVLGIRAEVTTAAAHSVMQMFGGRVEGFEPAIQALDEISKKDITVNISSWPDFGSDESLYAPTFDMAKARLIASVNPKLRECQLPHLQEAIHPKGFDYMPPRRVINERLKPTLEMFPELLQLMARQLSSLHNLFDNILSHLAREVSFR